MIGAHDRQETNEQMRFAIESIVKSRRVFNDLVDQLPPPLKGSMLDGDCVYTAREPIDTLVMAHRARAIENLERLFEIMSEKEDGQMASYPYSPYSLIRIGVEAAATAMWMIQSSKKADRVLRALQLSYRNSQEALRFAELIRGKAATIKVNQRTLEIFDQLKQLKDRVGPLKQVELGPPPSYTQILIAVSTKSRDRGRRSNGYEISSPLVAWKASSAFLHGSDQLVQALSDIRQIEEPSNGIASFEITPNLQLQATFIAVCVDLIVRLDERYTHLSTHDYANRPV